MKKEVDTDPQKQEAWFGVVGEPHRGAPELFRKQKERGENMGKGLYCGFHEGTSEQGEKIQDWLL